MADYWMLVGCQNFLTHLSRESSHFVRTLLCVKKSWGVFQRKLFSAIITKRKLFFCKVLPYSLWSVLKSVTPKFYYPPASGEFRNFTRLAVFSGCLSVMSIYGWDLLVTLNYIFSMSFNAQWNIFRFLDWGFDCLEKQALKKLYRGQALIFCHFLPEFWC